MLTICDDYYDVEWWRVKDEHITDDMIIGLDVINQAEVIMKQGKVTMKKIIDDDCNESNEGFINKIKAINFVVKNNEPDLSHI